MKYPFMKSLKKAVHIACTLPALLMAGSAYAQCVPAPEGDEVYVEVDLNYHPTNDPNAQPAWAEYRGIDNNQGLFDVKKMNWIPRFPGIGVGSYGSYWLAYAYDATTGQVLDSTSLVPDTAVGALPPAIKNLLQCYYLAPCSNSTYCTPFYQQQ